MRQGMQPQYALRGRDVIGEKTNTAATRAATKLSANYESLHSSPLSHGAADWPFVGIVTRPPLQGGRLRSNDG
jgi:murein DD-endopeptidase MepM/ murein hydrolase activator NlpD